MHSGFPSEPISGESAGSRHSAWAPPVQVMEQPAQPLVAPTLHEVGSAGGGGGGRAGRCCSWGGGRQGGSGPDYRGYGFAVGAFLVLATPVVNFFGIFCQGSGALT